VFPNDGTVARVGLTMPMALDLDDVEDPGAYDLLAPDDDRLPRGEEYVRRLLEREYGDRFDVETEFPRVEDRGKRGGTETYPISSTRPIDSPVAAGVAVVGGAMGTTSAFHEGGYHVAVRSGRIAGELAAADRLGRYNDVWKAAIGEEVRRNVAFAEMVGEYDPADWNRTIRTARRLTGADGPGLRASAGLSGLRLFLAYKRRKFGLRDGRYVQIPESAYRVGRSTVTA
jgi:electron-transferring-flavoprotein dehydrogenase